MSNAFGYGGGYVPNYLQASSSQYGSQQIDPVSGGPDMFSSGAQRQFMQNQAADVTQIPGLEFNIEAMPEESTMYGSLEGKKSGEEAKLRSSVPGRESIYENPLSPIYNRLGNLPFREYESGMFGDVNPATRGQHKRMTPEEMLRQSVSSMSQDQIRRAALQSELGGAQGMLQSFNLAGQNLKTMMGDKGYSDTSKALFGNRFYDKETGSLESRSKSLNQAYQSLVNRLQKDYFL